MSTIHDPPPELLSLRSSTTVYLHQLREMGLWAEQAADVNRVVQPDYAALLDQLRDQVRAAQLADGKGTPIAIARAVAELLGSGS